MTGNTLLVLMPAIVITVFFFIYHKIKETKSLSVNTLDIVIFMMIQVLYMILAILTRNEMLFYVALLFAFYYMTLWIRIARRF